MTESDDTQLPAWFTESSYKAVDGFAFKSVPIPKTMDVDEQVTWLKGRTIGQASCTLARGFTQSPQRTNMTLVVNPLTSVTSVDVKWVRGSEEVMRAMTVKFATGDPIEVDVLTYSSDDAERAEEFIDAVLEAIALV